MPAASPPSHTTASAVPVTTLRGVGPALAQKLSKLGLETLEDLLFHLPLRYEDRSHITPVGRLRPGDVALIDAEVRLADIVFSRRRSLLVRVSDGTGTLALRFYHFNDLQKKQFSPGSHIRAFGEVRNGSSGLEIYHPEYRLFSGAAPELSNTLTPIYPATEGVTQPRLRQLISEALRLCQQSLKLNDWLQQLCPNLPGQCQERPDSLLSALQYLHSPPVDCAIQALSEFRHPAQRRLLLEELLAHQLGLRLLREQSREMPAAAQQATPAQRQALLDQFGFSLTGAQQQVIRAIHNDMAGTTAMWRLVQGDVGSGKTAVAACAALEALASGHQCALMAPTELLAEQHLQQFRHWFSVLGYPVDWLVGRQTAKERRLAEARVSSGETRMVIGTHALFEASVQFQKLGLVLIDEQHRFGVEQRLRLREKGAWQGVQPHQLILTATPIPRTLAMSAYGDLDCSVIDELPPGRTPVKTVVMPAERRADIVARLHAACREGRQAYWVCTLIEDDETLDLAAAEATHAALAEALPGVRTALVHGRMKARDKATVMDAFRSNEMQLLVATTVIEVGVNVPNASLMVIENPERLGLAQLHQLRGRVGRGAAESHCVLLYGAPLSSLARERLAVMRDSNDGFRIAEKDLELRGPGEVLGTRQTGEMAFRLVDLVRDAALLPMVQQLAADTDLHSPAAEALRRRWTQRGERYVTV